MPTPDITVGKREMQGGLERYTFSIRPSAIAAAAKRAKGDESIFNRALVSWYLLSPRPDSRDILSKEIRPGEGGLMEVTLIIRRGHYALLRELQEHNSLQISPDGRIECDCHPGEIRWVMKSTLPNYGKEFDE